MTQTGYVLSDTSDNPCIEAARTVTWGLNPVTLNIGSLAIFISAKAASDLYMQLGNVLLMLDDEKHALAAEPAYTIADFDPTSGV